MSRELIVLGTASQAPTRYRNHNGYLLRWDADGILFDPGEGTQRQMLFAGARASSIKRICLTHFHGDHCLGLPGVIQRIALDGVDGPIDAHFPASGLHYWERLRHAAVFNDRTAVRAHPIDDGGVVADTGAYRLIARRLQHSTESFGYRIEEPAGRHMIPERLQAAGVSGPAVGHLEQDGSIEVAGRRITLDEVSEPRPGQRFAFVMDTGMCDAAVALAEDADMLVCESTFLSRDEDLARAYGHLTARQAAHIAAEAGARLLVLTHFSQRYSDEGEFAAEAGEVFPDLVVARDLDRVPVPPRRRTPTR